MTDAGGREQRVRLDFRSGGWVIALAVLFVLVIVGWRLITLFASSSSSAIGDGANVLSYRFDLSNLTIPIEELAPAGISKDGVHALVDPNMITTTEMDQQRLGRGPMLTPDDPVVGVAVGDEARAYPLRFLTWHEVANDTIAGQPILVTYSPLTDAVFVFDRTATGAALEFGVSGLLVDSNLVMFDRHPSDPNQESLWVQMQGRAIAGPRAGTLLKHYPFQRTTWQRWRQAHPETLVCAPDPTRKRLYRREPYNTYRAVPTLKFPADPLPPNPDDYKTPCIGVLTSTGWQVFRESSLAQAASPGGSLIPVGDAVRLRIEPDPQRRQILWVKPEPADTPVVTGYWFAWYSQLAGEVELQK